MNRFLAVFILLSATLFAMVQSGIGGGGQSNVSGGSAGSSGGGNQPGVFSLINYGGVDDDSTDNCANGSVAAFTAAVNAYSGPGVPVAIIAPGAANKAYKLATNANSCTFAFTRATGATVHVTGNIDCAQTAQSCMQFGPSGQVTEQATENYTLDGGGMFVGGASLTLAGVYMEPGINQFLISRIRFGRDDNSTTSGFGATNATQGSCTNWSIYIDTPIADGWVDHVLDFVVASSTSVGGCGMANQNTGGSAGTNTTYFESNLVGTAGANGATQCGSQGIVDGGSYGMTSNNNVYGFGVPIRLQGIGHRVIGNQIDAAGCSAHGVSAAFHIGAAGSSTAVGPLTIESNIGQFAPSGHTVFLMAIAGDSTATVAGATVIGNQNVLSGAVTQAIFPASLACATTTGPLASTCNINGNPGFFSINPGLSGTNAAGWGAVPSISLVFSPAVQSANLGSTSMGNAPIGHSGFLWCTVVETVKDLTSSTLPSCVVSYTDQISGATATQTVTTTNTTNAVGAAQSGFVALSVAAGNAINVSTTGYASNVAGTMHYQLQAFFVQY